MNWSPEQISSKFREGDGIRIGHEQIATELGAKSYLALPYAS